MAGRVPHAQSVPAPTGTTARSVKRYVNAIRTQLSCATPGQARATASQDGASRAVIASVRCSLMARAAPTPAIARTALSAHLSMEVVCVHRDILERGVRMRVPPHATVTPAESSVTAATMQPAPMRLANVAASLGGSDRSATGLVLTITMVSIVKENVTV